MFEKKEDKIFDYAFGDLDAHEAQIFEASLLEDKESLAEIEFLRSMKEDLVSLRDIPEMQFSKERLRSAILGQGLKPKKPIMPWINWLLAPTALACVAALGYVLMGGTAHKDFQYVPGGKNLAMGSKPTIALPKSPANETRVASNTDDDGFPDVKDTHWASEARGVRSHPIQHHAKHRDLTGIIVSNHAGTSAGVKPGSGKSVLAMAKSSSGTDSKDKGNEIVAMVNPASNDAIKVAFGNTNPRANDDSKLIVIDKDQDSGVGAATATEVVNTGNVLIGG